MPQREEVRNWEYEGTPRVGTMMQVGKDGGVFSGTRGTRIT
jgi:hypothetical protein